MKNNYIKDYVYNYSEALKIELKRAEDWHDSQKFNFIKGQLDILGKIRNMIDFDENKLDKNRFI